MTFAIMNVCIKLNKIAAWETVFAIIIICVILHFMHKNIQICTLPLCSNQTGCW